MEKVKEEVIMGYNLTPMIIFLKKLIDNLKTVEKILRKRLDKGTKKLMHQY